MPHKPPILPGHTYHIYNRGNNNLPIFFSDECCSHFIHLMRLFLSPVSDVLSYALMRNHVHIAMRIKNDEEIGWLLATNANNPDLSVKWMTSRTKVSHTDRKPKPIRMIQHLFSSYTKWLNSRHQHSGNLMEDRFERKIVNSEDQLRQLICYINCNPEKHGICRFFEYPWTSYHELVGTEESWLVRENVHSLFGSRDVFMAALRKVDFDAWVDVHA